MDASPNDADLVPTTDLDGRVLEFDWPALRVGVAEYEEGPTGCTVFHFPEGAATTAVDARGGLVGKTDDYEGNTAICFAGGSIYGLEAAAGVTAELFRRPEHRLENMPAVSGAIIFDYGGRDNLIYPDKALGRAALLAARPGTFPLGARGAGRNAGCGVLSAVPRGSGQGGAFCQVGPVKIAAFCVVNALGVVLNRQGEVVRGNRDAQTGLREHPFEELTRWLARGENTEPPIGNTTLTALLTNTKLDRRELTQLGRQVHASMARAIYPFHTLMDGDVLYAVTSDEVEHPSLSVAGLGMLASELMWDAVLSI